MNKNRQNIFIFCLCILVIIGALLFDSEEVLSSEVAESLIPEGLESTWDPNKYISINEIRPGMSAYCLTEYGTAGIEMFGLQIIDVIRNMDVGRDVILVKGTDERFIRTGPVAGCSGSPVYIEGRMAGALAYTWSYSAEAIYAATPIEDMLSIDQEKKTSSSQSRFVYDFSEPIVFSRISQQYKESLKKLTQAPAGAVALPTPLITSGISSGVSEQFKTMVEPLGFIVVSGGGNGTYDGEKIQLAPGSCLGVPLVSGDIQISTIGTVTEVIGDKVYGFGHLLLGYGEIDLPMATGRVHTVVSSTDLSFKLASILETVGALRHDESYGVIGTVGAKAKMIPLKIKVDSFNDSEVREYDCELASNKLLSSAYLQLAISGAALVTGDLPPEHMIEYSCDIRIEGDGSIVFSNVSSDIGLTDMISECISVMNLLMNNPYKEAEITSIDCEIRITPESISSGLWAVDLSDTRVKPGERIEIEAILEIYLGGKKKYNIIFDIPKTLEPGEYDLTICGSRAYEQFLLNSVPHRFVALNMPDLFDAFNNALAVKRDRLYCFLELPRNGIVLEKAELPDLPGTKALVLRNNKRSLEVEPYQKWIEKSIKIDSIVSGSQVIEITVEE